MQTVNLVDFSRSKLKAYLASLGEAPFRAEQLFKWIHVRKVSDFDEMTDLSKALRQQLKQHATVTLRALLHEKRSNDGTMKWLMQMSCGNSVETVFIPEKGRGTLCVSSQIGCGLNCSFCSTAKQGFNRDLSVSEIIGQVWLATKGLADNPLTQTQRVTNVVMMGMGEPLLNLDNVIDAMDIMMDDFAYGLSKRRVTLSTSGLVPQMLALKERSDVALAVSLHAPEDALRNELVPVNKKYPLRELMNVCRTYFEGKGRRRITFEYVMLDGVNDTLEHAKLLVRLLQGVPSKINLIPFNPYPGTQYKRSSEKAIEAFKGHLLAKGLNTTVRKTRGDDIDAACGQLVGQFNDKTRRNARWQKIKIQNERSA